MGWVGSWGVYGQQEEKGGEKGVGGLETAPVIISVSRHRGTWTSGAHVSLHSFAATRSREGGPPCVCMHFFFFMEASACICEQFCLLSGWCLNAHAQMCV